MVLADARIGPDVCSTEGGNQVVAMSTGRQRLSQLVERLHAQRLVVLGPVFEGPDSDQVGTRGLELTAWFREAFSGQLDVGWEGLEESISSTSRHAGSENPTQWTRGLRIRPFYFREWCQTGAEDTAKGAPVIIAARGGASRLTTSHSAEHPHFYQREDCLLLAPFSESVPGLMLQEAPAGRPLSSTDRWPGNSGRGSSQGRDPSASPLKPWLLDAQVGCTPAPRDGQRRARCLPGLGPIGTR